MEEKLKSSLKLFKIFFKLGFFAFGGGYSMIPLIEYEVVEKGNIVSKEEFLDIISVAEGLPGAIGLNISIFIGFMVNKYVGAIICAAGSILPSVTIVTSTMVLFASISSNALVQKAFYGVRPVVVALIGYAAYKISRHAYKYKLYILFSVLGFFLALNKILEIPFIVILGLGLGVVLNSIEGSLSLGKKGELSE